MHPLGVGGGDGGALGGGAGGEIPGGSHPPLTHVPPPSATKGSGVVHPVGDGGGGVVGEVPGGATITGGAGGGIPGGSQPPSKQKPPPIVSNGSGVAHPPKRICEPPFLVDKVPLVSLSLARQMPLGVKRQLAQLLLQPQFIGPVGRVSA